MKKSFVLFMALFFCVFSGACLTPALYSSSNKATNIDFIEGLKLNSDSSQLILVGKDYQYRFNLPKDENAKITKYRYEPVVLSAVTFKTDARTITILNQYDYSGDPIENTVEFTEKDPTKAKDHPFLHIITLNGNYIKEARDQNMQNTVNDPLLFAPAQPIMTHIPNNHTDVAKVAKKAVLTPFAVVGDALIIAGVVVATPFVYLYSVVTK